MYTVEKLYKKSKRVTVVNKCEKLEDAKASLEFLKKTDRTVDHVYRIIQIVS